jgi:hypothetical protein
MKTKWDISFDGRQFIISPRLDPICNVFLEKIKFWNASDLPHDGNSLYDPLAQESWNWDHPISKLKSHDWYGWTDCHMYVGLM